jgi:hypothetical protein
MYAHEPLPGDPTPMGHAFVWPQREPKLSRARRGEGNPNATLTLEQVTGILTSREPARVLAKRYSVTHSAVCRIRQGRSWGHYTPEGCLYRKGGRDGTGLRQKVRAKKLPADAPRRKRPSEMKCHYCGAIGDCIHTRHVRTK